MKTIIKLAIVILIANAIWRVSTAYISFYQFKDSVDELATHTTGTDVQLRNRVVELAAKYDEPIDPDAVSVRHSENHVYIETSYTKPVAVFPGYIYQWPFKVDVDGLVIMPTKLTDLPNSK